MEEVNEQRGKLKNDLSGRYFFLVKISILLLSLKILKKLHFIANFTISSQN